MLTLEEISAPNTDVITTQSQVVAFWEKDCLGQGVLYLTKSTLQWISDTTKKGFRLTYPAISVHAVSGASAESSEPSLFLMIDVNKTEPMYVEEEDDPSIKTAAIRFIPSNPSIVQELFETMNTCQMENPDPDEMISEDSAEGDYEEQVDEEMHESNGDHMRELSDSGHWFTTDTSTDEILLSAEGRANLERMLGNLNDNGDSKPPN